MKLTLTRMVIGVAVDGRTATKEVVAVSEPTHTTEQVTEIITQEVNYLAQLFDCNTENILIGIMDRSTQQTDIEATDAAPGPQLQA